MTEERNPLEVLLDEFVESSRRGENPKVEDYAERHPDLAQDIRELFPAAAALERARTDISDSRPSGPVIGPGPDTDLGDFHLIDEIGHGGMGVVYEAEQRSLQRHVALKVLPRGAMREERRVQRFRNEAQTAARLHHTNIVPIFGVGESEGYHFYVMQFIRGVGLDLVLAELYDAAGDDEERPRVEHSDLQPPAAVEGLYTGRLIRSSHLDTAALEGAARPRENSLESSSRYWRSIADIGLQVADALCYAHDQGTLHRDIKPANLLLDADGVVWVTDFGLARAIETDGMTGTGDVVGTLQYMSPEQLHGKYDARSDVYGLGLTLYELATHRPAFSGRERSGLIDKIQKGQPTAPRKMQPGIPIDLETIIVKAIATEPEHRYASAAELRRDLELFLEDRPIRSRRIGALEHGWRWCRRNRLVASLSAVAILAIFATAATGWTLAAMRSKLNSELNVALRDAEDNLNDGLGAIEDIFDRFAGRDPLDIYADEDTDGASTETQSLASFYSQPTVSEDDAALLIDLLGFYDRFAARNADNEDLQSDAARAYHRVGLIQSRLDQPDDAAAAFGKALQRYENTGDPDKYRLERASVHNDLGILMRDRGRGRFDRGRGRSGRGPRGRRAGPQPAGEDWRERYQKSLDDRRAAHRRALDLLTDAAASNERLELARTHELLGDTYPRFDRGRGPGRPRTERDDAQLGAKHFERARELREQLLAENPKNPPYREAVARSCRQMASLLRYRDEDDAAQEMNARAVELIEELVADYPGEASYKATLIDMLRRGPGRATGELERAWKLACELVDAHPTSREYAGQLHDVLRSTTRSRGGRGPSREAESPVPAARAADMVATGLECLERSTFGSQRSGAFQLLDLRSLLAQLYLRDEVGRAIEAKPLLQRSISLLEQQQSAEDADDRMARMRGAALGFHYRLLGKALDQTGDPEGAEAARAKADELPEFERPQGRQRGGGRGR